MNVYRRYKTQEKTEEYILYRITKVLGEALEGGGEAGITLLCTQEKTQVTTSFPLFMRYRVRAFLKEAGVKEARGLEGRVILGLRGKNGQ